MGWIALTFLGLYARAWPSNPISLNGPNGFLSEFFSSCSPFCVDKRPQALMEKMFYLGFKLDPCSEELWALNPLREAREGL